MIYETKTELTPAKLTVQFEDDKGLLATPTRVTYQIDCLTTGQSVLAATDIMPASQVTIDITSAQNTIINSANHVEMKRVTVLAYSGSATPILTVTYDYYVENLAGV